MSHRFHNSSTTMASILLAASLALSAGIAVGDTTTKKSSSGKAEAKPNAAAVQASDDQMKAMMAEMAKYAAPGAEHQALNPLVGTWKTTIKTWMGPGDPTVSQGTCDRSWALGGRYLIGSYKGDFGGAPFEGMETVAFDKMKKHYVSTWIDNMGTAIYVAEGGTMDPTTKTLTLSGKTADPMTGNEYTMRNVTNIVDDNTHTFSMYATRDGKEHKEMEITFTRVK